MKVAQINAENLFLFLDEVPAAGFQNLSERDWQKLSHASVPNKSLVKTRWLAETLLEINADIVGVNEVGGLESLTNFARYFLRDQYQAYLIEGNSDRGIDVGYLVKRQFARDHNATFELRSHKDRPLNFLYPHEQQSNAYFASVAPEKVVKTHYFSRDCAELRLFRPGQTSPALVFLLVHLKSKLDPEGIDPQGKTRRAAEARVLAEIYREIRNESNPPPPVLVAGDFNGFARPEKSAEEFAEFARSDLKSVVSVAGHADEKAATQILFSRTSGMQCLEIDFIFMSPELESYLVKDEVEVFRYRSDLNVVLALPQTLDQRLALPSDHYPVVAVFKNLVGLT